MLTATYLYNYSFTRSKVFKVVKSKNRMGWAHGTYGEERQNFGGES
jgi:hypothetical protein